jgi:coiled-coil domain-containing protein 63/114
MREQLTQKDDVVGAEGDKQVDKQQNDKKVVVGDFSNHINVLRLRLAKIIATNKEKKRLMDQYLRNVKVIEDAFEQIKDATGIASIDEIVTSFIKAEEQNYSLYNYVNMLGTETDLLEESNGEIKEQIDRIIQRGKMTESEKVALK